MPQTPAIISVHVPKSGGVSFQKWLAAALGKERVLLDYGDGVVNPAADMNRDPEGFLAKHARTALPDGYRAVHGHFWVEKYRKVKDALRICFLRDPVERTVSNYFYWKTAEPKGHELHRRFLDEGWSLPEFARVPEMRHFYRDHYFRGAAIDQMDFVGDMAAYGDEVQRLERQTGLKGVLPVENRNRFGGYDERVGEIFANAGLMSELRDILAPEIEFYERHAGRK